MTARTITKEYSHYLVKWGSQDQTELLVVPRSKILAEGRIKIGETYNTIWGDSSAEADEAEMIATGEWLEMRKQLKLYKDALPTDASPESSPSPIAKSTDDSSPDVPPPPPKRQRVTLPKLKPDAKVIRWCEGIRDTAPVEDPYQFRSVTPSPVLPIELQPPTPPSPTPSTPQSPIAASGDKQLPGNSVLLAISDLKSQVQVLNERSLAQDVAMAKLQQQNERLIHLVQSLVDKPAAAAQNFTPHRPWGNTTATPTREPRQLMPTSLFSPSPTNTPVTPVPSPTIRMPPSTTRLVPSSNMFNVIDSKFQHIPPQYQIAACDLVREFNSSSGPGNFAKHLLEFIFPELYTQDCLRRHYSYHGDFKNNKNPLDQVRIQFLMQYVCHFYPEVKQPQAWKLMVVTKINQALRRPVKQQKKSVL
ncbi:Hypothetical predicted protein [Mytilus galloprovincialis]|uniref:BEN domain-containing protein n=1 Tax=Mytilus galloprovincialis TaxID=29158 RepID=A0A8B6G4Q5_MYTGA|nr:Hypothetical predicted protein [Mytilus galloprovincialis]